MTQDRMESAQEQYDSGDPEPAELSEDLVCGLLVGLGSATKRVRHEGQDYYFCSQRCAEAFRSNPLTYLKPAGDETSCAFSLVDSGGDNDEPYTCPMHSEVELSGPGTCPKCGIALEPSTFELEDEQDDPGL